MSYIKLRGRYCGIIVLNVYAPTENKNDDMKHNFYEGLERFIISRSSTWKLRYDISMQK
jgi:hypothetical protein